jgi:hypothetical protein
MFLSIVLIVLAFLLGWFLARWFRKSEGTPQPPPPSPSPPPPPPPPPSPTFSIPDNFSEQALPAALSSRLMGTPADGVPAAAGSAPLSQVIWVDGGHEVLVHLDSTQVQILDGLLLVSVDLETDQTPRSALVCVFALGSTGDQAGLVATTDEFPRGNGDLAASWGKQFQQAVWSSILALANDHATERDQAPRGVFATAGTLSLSAGPRMAVSAAGKSAL